jgi:hypothetical protein
MTMTARDSMKRVRRLLAVAKCFAAKGVEKDDNPGWVAETFAMLIDVIESEVDDAATQFDLAPRAEAIPADHRPAA